MPGGKVVTNAPPAGSPPGPRHDLAVCGIFRDEAPYLDEWLTFHRGVGAGRFYLYNDRSQDDYEAVLRPWIDRGIVVLEDWPQRSLVEAFNDCLERHREEAAWMAFIDLDEFLYSPTGRSVPDVLRGYEDAAAVFVYWSLFGSSGQEAAPDRSVIRSYRRCQGLAAAIMDDFDHGVPGTSDHITAWSRDGKSVVRTAWIETMNNHQPSAVRRGRVVDEHGLDMPTSARERRTSREPFSYSILRINHYWSKSLAELSRRTQRSDVFDRTRPNKRLERLLERERQLNDCLDEAIQPIWDAAERAARHAS